MTGSLSYFRQMTENVSVNKNSICVMIKLKKNRIGYIESSFFVGKNKTNTVCSSLL